MSTRDACGRSPAAPIKLKRNVGLVLVHRTYTAKPVLCAACAEIATKEFQRETLVKGWTSPRSALFNPATIAGNAIRQKRHERRLRNSQSPAPVNSSAVEDSEVDASDLLIAFGGASQAEFRQLQGIVLDYQGGGLTSTSAQVEAVQQVPDKDTQRAMGDIARSLIEKVYATQSVQMYDDAVLAFLTSELNGLIGLSAEDTTPTHHAVATATITAIAALLRSKRQSDAFYVALMGQTLYANTADWLAAGGVEWRLH